MKLATAVVATIALVAVGLSGAARAAPPEQCDVPPSLMDGDTDLSRVMEAFKTAHRLYYHRDRLGLVGACRS